MRAIHLEVSQSQETDSFINMIRRFIAQRGQPEEVRKFCAWGEGAAGSDQGLESVQDRGISTTAKHEMEI